MAATKLTARFCEAQKGEPGRQVALRDALVAGLEFRVSGQGRKSWSLRYRNGEGRQCRVSLGEYPATDLPKARQRARKILSGVDDGNDPARERRLSKARAAQRQIETLGDLMDDYLAACEAGTYQPRKKKMRASTLDGYRRNWRLHLEKQLGKRPVDEITRAVVKSRLRDIVAAGSPVAANRVHALIRSAFNYALVEEVAPDLVKMNPAAGFASLGQETAGKRILSDSELKTLWGALKDPTGLKLDGEPLRCGRAMRIALQLCALLLQRKSEIVGMRTDELRLPEALWIVPADRTKSGKAPNAVPLPPAAVELIEEALALRKDTNCMEVFPSRLRRGGPILPRSLSHALAEITEALRIEEASPHDLRRTGSTALTGERIGMTQFIRSQVLGHASDTGGGAAVSRAHYDVNSYLAEKRRALVAWVDLLLEIVGDKPRVGNVVHIKGDAA